MLRSKHNRAQSRAPFGHGEVSNHPEASKGVINCHAEPVEARPSLIEGLT